MKTYKFYLICSLFILTSCSKYEDNEGITLNSKKDRLSRLWEAKTLIINGQTYNSLDWEIIFSYDEFAGTVNGSVYSGDWDFEDNKESMKLDYDHGAMEIWEIKRLEKDHLWVNIDPVGFNDKVYVEFEPAD